MKKRNLFTMMAAGMLTVLCAIPAFAGELESGSYSMKQGEKSVNVYVNSIKSAKNYTAINMYDTMDSDNTQDFILARQDDGTYKISISKSGFTMNVMSLKSGTDVIVYQDKKANNEYYKIVETDRAGYYNVFLNNKDSLALTATGGKGLTFKTFKEGDSSQQFYFEANATANSGQADSAAENISLSVPRISTQDKKWADFYYDTGAKIKDYGCLLCSACAVLSETDETTYRPDEIAEKFSFDDGYMQWGSGWGKRFKSSVEYSLATVVSELKSGRPVIVHGYSSTYGHHYAVITGMSGNGSKTSQFTVMDPSFSSTKTLDQFFKTFPGKKSLILVKE